MPRIPDDPETPEPMHLSQEIRSLCGPYAEPAEKLGINVFDLQAIGDELFARMLAGRLELDKGAIVRLNPDKPQETFIPFACDTLTAAVICDILRNEARKQGDSEPRVYINKDGKWSKMSQKAVLTMVRDEKSILNPNWFPSVLRDVEIVPLQPKRVL